MAYYSGTAASLSALRTALLTHAQADGWTLTGNVLSKAGVYFQITETATHISCLGCEDNSLTNPAPSAVRIGEMFNKVGSPTYPIMFPCNYEVFGFSQELFMVVNYDVSLYQWMAFGKSKVPGLVNAGGWCGATLGGLTPSMTSGGVDILITITPTIGGETSMNSTAPALFWTTEANYQQPRTSWVNHGLDGHGWAWGSTLSTDPIGIQHALPLIKLLPSAWSSETVLLPIRAYKERPDYKSSLIADLEHARLVRIDNLSPGDVLTIGSDKWKVFPWYKKNSTYRDGTSVYTAGGNHTGTLGWAIRYEGP